MEVSVAGLGICGWCSEKSHQWGPAGEGTRAALKGERRGRTLTSVLATCCVLVLCGRFPLSLP